MTDEHRTVIKGLLLDESVPLSLGDLSRACAVRTEVIVELVHEGIVAPRGGPPSQWRFAGEELVRIERALRLQRELDLNLAGTALVIDLLEELRELRSRVRALQQGLYD